MVVIMDFNNLGAAMIIFGLIIAVVGIIIYFSGSYFSWIGNLPGDIKIERDNFTLYLPITTMILISIILNIVIRIIYYFFK